MRVCIWIPGIWRVYPSLVLQLLAPALVFYLGHRIDVPRRELGSVSVPVRQPSDAAAIHSGYGIGMGTTRRAAGRART